MISIPKYCGGFYGDFTWLYLNSAPTDGDLQTGTFLNLTSNPDNLHAVVQQLEPDTLNAYRVNIGYRLPCSNGDFNLNYFHYNPDDSRSKVAIFDLPESEQFFQNFLGESWTNFNGFGHEKINQINLTTGKRFFIDRCLGLHPFVGISYADISRKLTVNYNTLVPTLDPLFLEGTVNSHFCGIGPMIGMDFSLPIFKCIYLDGRLEGGLLFGDIKSKTDSTQTDENDVVTDSFHRQDKFPRAATFLKSQIALTYRPCFRLGCVGIELTGGYETDYFFKAINRLNPLNGYLINPNPAPTSTSSNWGLGGPFVKLSVGTFDFDETDCCFIPKCGELLPRLYARFVSSWLKSEPNNSDLVYATLHKSDGSIQNLHTHFDYSWAGTYEIGYRFCNDYFVSATYFQYDDDASTATQAATGEFIKSVNSSGNAIVDYSSSSSRVEYHLNQPELKIGKAFSPYCRTELQLDIGVRYAQLRRVLQNTYSGGVPSTNFETKDAILKSNFHGTGPVFSMSPVYTICNNLDLKGSLSTAFLIGNLKSSLDQINQGESDSSSNTLRTPWTRTIVPVVDVFAGLSYNFCFACGMTLEVEAGYQFSEYYRAINLVYPTLRTGLEQLSSDLKLHGPFISLKLGNY